MANQFVVRHSETDDLYMIHYDPDFNLCGWGSIEHPDLMIWNTLEDAQNIASSINSGTVGTVKPPVH